MNHVARFVDSGYWIALVNTRDSLHRRARMIVLAHDEHFVQAGFRALLRE